MSLSPPKPPTSLGKILTFGSAVGSQGAWLSTLNNWYSISLYHPGIYDDGATPFFLVVPFVIGIGAAWLVLHKPWAMWMVIGGAVVLAGIVWATFAYFPADSFVHKVNWVASYCVLSLAAAGGMRLILDVL